MQIKFVCLMLHQKITYFSKPLKNKRVEIQQQRKHWKVTKWNQHLKW